MESQSQRLVRHDGERLRRSVWLLLEEGIELQGETILDGYARVAVRVHQESQHLKQHHRGMEARGNYCHHQLT